MPVDKMGYVSKYRSKNSTPYLTGKVIIFLLVLFTNATDLSAQDRRIMKITLDDQKYIFQDSLKASNQRNRLISNIQFEGYFDVHSETVTEGDTAYINIIKGRRYQWLKLRVGNIPLTLLNSINISHRIRSNEPFSYSKLKRFYTQILARAESSGYPFAQLGLDSIVIRDDVVQASLDYNSGPLIVFDNIELVGYDRINEKWLSSYLEIIPGEPFNQIKVNEVSSRLERMDYLELQKEPHVTFQNAEATVFLEPVYRKANIFDALIGFAPGAGNEKDLLITGQVQVDLHNIFRRGHQLLLDWRSIRPETQQLDFSYRIPNLFNSPINVAGSLNLFRQDSAFFNQEWLVEASIIKKKWEVGVYSKIFNSAVQLSQQELSGTQEVNVNYVGVTGNYVSRKGRFTTKLGIGQRQVEDIPDPLIQLEVFLEGTRDFTIGGGFYRISPLIHYLESETLFTNDLLRTGGIRSIRGFPENSFFTPFSTIIRNEYHWRFNNGSSFFILADGALLETDFTNYAFGTGLGFDLKVNNGNFELIYAVGGYDSLPVSFENSVLHFGYSASF